jgi:outer membrane receptor protein involved in Fe transport
MKKFLLLSIATCVIGLGAIASLAQTNTTGTVSGTVTDKNGAVVPNATLTLAGPNLIQAQTATTNSDGTYRFVNVPPGRYTLSVGAVSGFTAYKQPNVEVNLEKTTTLDIVMVTTVGATVDVNATPEVDTTSNVTGSNISTEFFSNIPTSRTVQGLYTIAPTVARSGLRDASGRDRDPSVAGSSGPENSYILDGVTTTDPAFGGGGANLPFEFVQEVQVKTGAFGADQGLSTGGVFNVITKTGGNQFHGDAFGYFATKGLVAKTKNFSQSGSSPDGFSEQDVGIDIGGPIKKDKLTFFAAFNPQSRKNYYLTQTFNQVVTGKITTPFYSGKVTWQINSKNVFNVSTFGDKSKQKGFLFGGSGFGANPASFLGEQQLGGTNYSFRLNSTMRNNLIGEYSFGIHRQRNNVIPDASVAATALVTDNFAILKGGAVVPVTSTGVTPPDCTPPVPPALPPPTCGAATYNGNNTGQVDFVFAPGGSLQRNFVRNGFGLFQNQARNRTEFAAKEQWLAKSHSVKFGFEYYRNVYDINQRSTGPSNVFANPLAVAPSNGANPDNLTVSGFRVTNSFSVCTTIGTVITCPSSTAIAILQAAQNAGKLPTGFTLNTTATAITADQALNNPFLVRTTTRVRDFKLVAKTHTSVESFYVQDDYKITKNLQLNIGGRWDYQQANGNEGVYLKLNNFKDNFQPRLGFIWDFTGEGKGKIYANYAKFIETPLPLDINVRAGSNNTQTDKNFNVNMLNAPLNATVATGFATRNLGAESTPIDPKLKPQDVKEWTAGIERQFRSNYTVGVRGIYRAQGNVIEDGSFDDGDHYFLFNPGVSLSPDKTGTGLGNTEFVAGLPSCPSTDPGYKKTCGGIGQHFGHARRYYRAIELTLNRRFANNFSFNASYVFSSLIGNYEGLFRNDNGQADPNITSLFDLVSLLTNMYGRLPNDRPHQFKFNGSYQTPWKLILSSNFYAQSGIPFNQLIPHPVYGNNEGFAIQRGTAIIPNLPAAFAGGVTSIGTNRTPFTWNLDLGAYYPIHISESKQLRITADWFNVTNTQRAVTVDNTFSINSGVGGVPPVLNPFWGSGTIFQYPSNLRLGAKFTW